MDFDNSFLNQDLHKIAEYINCNDYSDCRILVTGATGLLGSLCIKAFLTYKEVYKKQISIIGIARNSNKVKNIFDERERNSIKFIYQDVVYPLSRELKVDYIIHTASPTTSKYFMTNPVEVIDSIYLGTKNILEFAFATGVKGVVYLSSMEVFGVVEKRKSLFCENDLGYIDLQNIRSCYSEGKRAAELLCKLYVSEYDLPIKIARLAQIFGAGVSRTENRVFAQFLRSAISGENIVLHTTGQSLGNYCYTADAIKAIILILKKGCNGAVYNVVNEENTITIADMAQMVATEFSQGKSKVVFDIPDSNLYGYAPDTQLKLSNRKLVQLGWKPEISLKEMYRRMLPYL